MAEEIFEQSLSAICRLAAVRAAATASLYQLPTDSRQDLEQEALLELWRKRPAYDPQRGSWRTFSERVVANRITSLVRSVSVEAVRAVQRGAARKSRGLGGTERPNRLTRGRCESPG